MENLPAPTCQVSAKRFDISPIRYRDIAGAAIIPSEGNIGTKLPCELKEAFASRGNLRHGPFPMACDIKVARNSAYHPCQNRETG